MVGTAARTLVSSVMLRLSSKGTFRSTLTNTLFPFKSPSFNVPTLLLVAISSQTCTHPRKGSGPGWGNTEKIQTLGGETHNNANGFRGNLGVVWQLVKRSIRFREWGNFLERFIERGGWHSCERHVWEGCGLFLGLALFGEPFLLGGTVGAVELESVDLRVRVKCQANIALSALVRAN